LKHFIFIIDRIISHKFYYFEPLTCYVVLLAKARILQGF
jgi:hypothetical protein